MADDRKDMIHCLLILMLSLLVTGSLGAKPPSEETNFIVIIADDLGYYDVSYNGSVLCETPYIDALAARSLIFTNAYASSPVCSPTRASNLTGRFAAGHGVTAHIREMPGTSGKSDQNRMLDCPLSGEVLKPEYVTLPESLEQAGYATLFAGKWHLGRTGSYPEDHGFQINKGGSEVSGPYSNGYFSPFRLPFLDDVEEEKGMTLAMKMALEAERFITDNQDNKFIAWISFYEPHSPLQTSQERWEKYRLKAEANGIDEEAYIIEGSTPMLKNQDNPVYAGLVEQMDEAIGYLMGALERTGLDKNTVIIFMSDNGGAASGDVYATSNAPLRGGKGYIWEGGIRVPFFIYDPQKEHGGIRCDVPIAGTDLYPTILDMAGLDLLPEEHIDGTSLLPLLKGKKPKANKIGPRPLYWHYPHYSNQGGTPASAIREGNWKLIHFWETGLDALFDLENDPGETTDLAGIETLRASTMNSRLMNWLESVDARFPAPNPQFIPAVASVMVESKMQLNIEKLKRERSKVLDKNFTPNNGWWGSCVP